MITLHEEDQIGGNIDKIRVSIHGFGIQGWISLTPLIHSVNYIVIIIYCTYLLCTLLGPCDMEVSSCSWSLRVKQIDAMKRRKCNKFCTRHYEALCGETLKPWEWMTEGEGNSCFAGGKKDCWVKQTKIQIHPSPFNSFVTLASYTRSGSSSLKTAVVLNQ